MKTLTLWCENHRNDIGNILNAVASFAQFVFVVLARTLFVAGIILLYLLFNAAPETTLYQFSQMAHSEQFLVSSVLLAVVYTVIFALVQGRIPGMSDAQLAYAICTPVHTAGEMTATQTVASTPLQEAICVMRKYGFRIIREGRPGDDLQQDALNTACLMLGLEATADNKCSVAVADLAKTLANNI